MASTGVFLPYHMALILFQPQANSGPNSNGCQVSLEYRQNACLSHVIPQFFITTAKCDFLDGKHVVFGRVSEGMLTLRKIENVPTGPNNRPKLVVKITGGLLNLSARSSH